MAEYLIQEETLTGIADKIRILSGTEGAMTTAEMQSELETFNADMGTVVTAQDDLIAQITTALEGKAAVSLPTLTNPASAENIESGYEAIDGDGNVIGGKLVKAGVAIGTVSGDSASITIPVDFIPDSFSIIAVSNVTSSRLRVLSVIKDGETYRTMAAAGTSAGSASTFPASHFTLTGNELTVQIQTAASSYRLYPGVTYYWNASKS